METETKEQILKKAEGLLAMTTSKNENEVTNANLLLKKLLNKYSLDINEIQLIKNKKETVIRTEYDFGNSMQPWEIILGNSISKFYDCRSLYDKHNKNLTFIGFSVDVKITIQVFDYVSLSFERIVREKMSEALNKRGFRQSFFTGAVNALALRLIEMKLKTDVQSNCKDLVVLKSHEINSFLEEVYGKIKDRTISSSISNTNAYYHGRATGKTISLNKQVE